MQGVRVFGPEVLGARAVSHAAVPVAMPLSQDRLRVFVSSRDEAGCSLAYFVDLDSDSLSVVGTSDGPLFELGARGCFDEHGTMPSSVQEGPDGKIYLYYIGWNRGEASVPYRVSIGCVVSEDASTFERVSDGPVLDRNRLDPIFVTTPFVRFDGQWTMFYSTASKWEDVDGRPEPFYHLARASSSDGLDWHPQGPFDVPLKADAVTRPTIIDRDGHGILAFCHRRAQGYRTSSEASYRIGLARLDEQQKPTILTTELQLDDLEWASSMRCYPSLVDLDGRTLMLYNGDGFGRTGVGAAWLPQTLFDAHP